MLEVKCKNVINNNIFFVFIMLIVLIFHAISSLGRIEVSFIVYHFIGHSRNEL